MKCSVTYVFHDCYVVRTPLAVLVFDFWKRPDEWISKSDFIGSSPLTVADLDKRIYIFVSHFHKDHYNKEIFSWGERFSNVTYIISRDVARHARHILVPGTLYAGPRPLPESVRILTPGKRFTDGLITVDAFDSTDIGCSFVVAVNGISIFHAGDLNAWLWKDESTDKEIEDARNAFLTCLRPVVEKYPSLELAFFPVDSRIGTDYQEGARLLLRLIKIQHFIPMHFSLGETAEEREKLRMDAFDFASYSSPSDSTLFIGLSAPGDSFAW